MTEGVTGSMSPELGLHSPLRCFVAQLQDQFAIDTTGPVHADRKALSSQHDMHAAITVSNTCLANFLDALFLVGLITPARLVAIGGCVQLQNRA